LTLTNTINRQERAKLIALVGFWLCSLCCMTISTHLLQHTTVLTPL